jgi:hypothetical protein
MKAREREKTTRITKQTAKKNIQRQRKNDAAKTIVEWKMEQSQFKTRIAARRKKRENQRD